MRKKPARDENEMAFEVVSRTIQAATSASDAARLLSKLGASKGGKRRAAKLTARRRIQIARFAALARWKKSKNTS